METKEGEKPIKRKYRGMTRKHMIIKNRSKGVKLPVKYNLDGIFIGESAVHLTSYLGVLARTMVPIRYKTWHVVPKQLKDKLWDSIETAFSLNHKSRRNCMLTMGKCFRSFKNLLTVKYILPFEDQPELLKRPPIQYTFIEDEDWTIFVKDRLSDNFKDKLLKESQENGRSVSGSNDILVEALGTPEYSGRVRAKGKHYTPRQYFNSAADRAVRDFIAASKEEQRIFQAEVLAKLSQVRKCELAIGTKENIVAGGTIILECGPNYLVVVDAPYDSSAPLPIPIPGQTTTVGAAIGYQVLWPTDLVIIRTPILASKKAKKQKVNEVEVKSKGEKPQDMKNFETLASKKAKKQKVNEVEVKSKGEKPQDMKNFETLVGLMLSTSRAYPINFPEDVFGESFKTFMMKEDMEMIISSKEVSSNCILYYIWHLHRKLIDAKQAERYVLSIQHCFHWVLVALEMKKMIAYYLDPMACQPCDDLKDIVNMAMRINPPEKQKTSKREPTWVKVVCPRQPGSVECGYYVMRYMKEIIANPNQLTSKYFDHQSKSRLRRARRNLGQSLEFICQE
ncbi:hypothetical protein CK203_006965 [Vitis vinifera]|uniref:Ubiquitin-like protease family profile domain-containing protein n=1 Tax=Vitis vinifera TaxID=29760 RepID=A0A438KC46_VITVI|nr:hypothetical protein CK203_006965 [Vitis vinifera]